MAKWPSGNELTDKWNIQGFELLDLVCKGLQPYDPATGVPVPPPEIRAKRDMLQEHRRQLGDSVKVVVFDTSRGWRNPKMVEEITQQGIEFLDSEIAEAGSSWENCCLPESKEDRLSLISEALSYVYKQEDVERFEVKHNLSPNEARELGGEKAKSDDSVDLSDSTATEMPPIHGSSEGGKRKRRNHKLYGEVRDVATSLFKENPGIKTAHVIEHKRIKDVLEKYGKSFNKDTLREWIQDLNPNYKPKIPK